MVGLKSQKGEEMRVKQINWQIIPPSFVSLFTFHVGNFLWISNSKALMTREASRSMDYARPNWCTTFDCVSLLSLCNNMLQNICQNWEKSSKRKFPMLWCVCYFFQTHWKPTNLENWFPMLGKAAFCNIRLGLKCVSMLWEYTIPSPAPHFKIRLTL